MSEEQSKPILMDIRVDQWSFAKKLAFRKAVADIATLIGEEPVGVNASYARLQIERAANAAIIGQAQGRPDAHDEMTNLDMKWLVAFSYIAEREHDGNATVADILDRVDDMVLLEKLYDVLAEEIKADNEPAAPLGEAESSDQTAQSSPPGETSSKSSSSSPADSPSQTSSP